MSNLLLDESPLLVSPTLACAVGLNEAIVLQQVHYWICINERNKNNYHDGRFWVYDSYEAWQRKNFPFWSVSTIKRAFLSLKKRGIIIHRQFRGRVGDFTNFYTIDYDALESTICDFRKKHENGESSDQVKMTYSIGSKWSDGSGQVDPNTEIPTKTPSKTSLNVLHGIKSDDFDSGILEKQILKVCQNLGIERQRIIREVYDVILYFYRSYWRKFRVEHPRLNNKTMTNVVLGIINGSESGVVEGLDLDMVDYEYYTVLIDKYFDTYYENCNYSISHFMSGEIRDNRFYETMY